MTQGRGLLVVSDLHLSEGRHPESGRISPNEDFFADEEFCAFLGYHQDSSVWPQTRWHLVINGDFVDFLQVTSLPEPGEPLLADPEYGLKAGPKETVWKLGRIVAGHQEFFAALSEFAARDKVTVVVGNHDIEFTYPLVQEALRETLCGFVTLEQQEAVKRNLHFEPWFFFDGEIYIEHGHQYDSLNSFRYLLNPCLPELKQVSEGEVGHIDLPLGSLFVRYLFNQVETSSPFADNVKPPTRFLQWFLSNHPFRATKFLFNGGIEMLRRVKRKWHSASETAYQRRRIAHTKRIETLAESLSEGDPNSSEADWCNRLRRLDGLKSSPILAGRLPLSRRLIKLLLGPIITPVLLTLQLFIILVPLLEVSGALLLPALPAALSIELKFLYENLSPWFLLLVDITEGLFAAELVVFCVIWAVRRRKPPALAKLKLKLREKAASIESVLHPRLILMGHIHEPDLWKVTATSEYLNSGTWTKVFSPEEQLIREEKELTFVRIRQTPKGPRAKLLKWEGERQNSRLVYLFSE